MTPLEALKYLSQQHVAIAGACVSGRRAEKRGETVYAVESLAMQIVAAEAEGDKTALVALAQQWKAGAK